MDTLVLGLTLGFWAGINPGPLTLLVIRQGLTYGARAAALAATAPLITDSLAIVLVFFVARNLPPNFELILEAIGGAFLIYLGAQGLRKAIPAEPPANAASQSIREAIVVNITNPHMYLFWFAVGIGQLKKPMPEPIWFLLGFYPAIVGAKVAIGLVAARTRHLPWLRPLARWSNALLILIGVYLLFKAFSP